MASRRREFVAPSFRALRRKGGTARTQIVSLRIRVWRIGRGFTPFRPVPSSQLESML